MAIYVEWRQSVSLTGTVVKWLAAAMVVPLLTSFVYGGKDAMVFVASMAIAVAVGWGLEQVDESDDLGTREALLFVALAWFAVSVVGAVPYVLAGWGTESALAHPVNALFEATSGFTTTGATVTEEISFERHSHALLIWRQAFDPVARRHGDHRADDRHPPGSRGQRRATDGLRGAGSQSPEADAAHRGDCPRPLAGVPRVHRSLRAPLAPPPLPGIAPEMNAYNAIAHGFTTLPTGGFSPQAESIAYFSPAVQWLVIPFMLVAGVNFALFWHLLNRDVDLFFGDPEFRAYVGANVVISIVLFVLLFLGSAPTLEIGGTTAGQLEHSLRQAAFQVGSLLNSTGYATSDFAQWDTDAQVVLLFAMFVGGSAGSTGGGVKVVRWLVVLKVLRRELFTAAHPEAVKPIRLGRHRHRRGRGPRRPRVHPAVPRAVRRRHRVHRARRQSGQARHHAPRSHQRQPGDPREHRPGIRLPRAVRQLRQLPATSKLFMVFLMLVGRLEIIPVLALFTGGFWRR